MLSLVIIPDETKVELDKKVMEYNDIDLLDGHVSALIDFVKNNNIDIPDCEQETSYGLSHKLTRLGYMNFHFVDNKVLMYLPYSLSDNQANYIKDNFKILSKFSIKLASLNLDNEFDIYEKADEEYKSMSPVLMKIVKRKVKIRKYLESQENNNRMGI